MPVMDPYTAARGRWDSVMRLPPGAVIDVLTVDGRAHVGAFAGADGYRVNVLANGIEEQVPRAEIVRVDLVDLPGSEVAAAARRGVTGAALGVGVAALISGAIGGALWPPPGAMLRSGAAIGGAAGVESSLSARQKRVIYLAEDQRLLVRRQAEPGEPVRSVAPAGPTESYPPDRWAAIVQLPADTSVAVVMTSGARHEGLLIAADDDAIRIDVGQAEVRIPRASVRRVEVFRPRPATSAGTAAPPARRFFEDTAVDAVKTSVFFAIAQGTSGAASVPLVRLGLPTLPFGGAQAAVLRNQMPTMAAMPGPFGAPPPAMSQPVASVRPMRAAICHSQPVRVRR
jgi:hypothetical protein